MGSRETSWRASKEGRRLGHHHLNLRVSAITTKRAYADLEAAGLIETVQGKGTYVAGGNAELIREEQMREVEGLFAKAVERGRGVGLTDDELSEMFALVLE